MSAVKPISVNENIYFIKINLLILFFPLNIVFTKYIINPIETTPTLDKLAKPWFDIVPLDFLFPAEKKCR